MVGAEKTGMIKLTEDREVTSYNEGQVESILEPLVAERYLLVRLNGQEVVRLASSPEAGRELAVGYLLSEGILKPSAVLSGIIETAKDLIDITTTAAGIKTINTCISPSYTNNRQLKEQKDKNSLFTPEQLLSMISQLDQQSLTFQRTGGVHSAGLGAGSGLLKRFEDIGRHNAVDKVFGYAFFNKIPLQDKCLVLSGRVAHEILLKAAHNEIPVILSRSAPTLMSVDVARKSGITVIGFARGRRFNVYSHPERICFGQD